MGTKNCGRGWSRKTGWSLSGCAVVLLLLASVLTACGDTVTAPSVVGMRLDAAHRKFEALGVKDFADKDVIGHEDTIFLDSHWVVVKQTPKAGTKGVSTDTKVKLEVGNQNDKKVLTLIPTGSPFAKEMSKKKAKTAKARTSAKKKANAEASKEPKPSTSAAPINEAAVACRTRKGNPGEIYEWNSYGTDQPPEAIRLGAGYTWDFGDKKCITSTQMALTTNPPLPGYCTEVGKVAANPGYNVDAHPAPRLKNIIGQSGDC